MLEKSNNIRNSHHRMWTGDIYHIWSYLLKSVTMNASSVYRSYSWVSQTQYINILFLTQNHILRPPDRCQKALFYQYAALRNCAVVGHQMYSGSSVKGSKTDQEISSTPPPKFTGGRRKCEIWRIFNITQLWAAGVWKCSKVSELCNKSAMMRWSPYVLAKFEVGSTPRPLRIVCYSCPTPCNCTVKTC